MTFFKEIEKSILKNLWKHKTPHHITLTLKEHGILTKHTEDQWTRIDNPEINPCI
jgi:hypothetical protein